MLHTNLRKELNLTLSLDVMSRKDKHWNNLSRVYEHVAETNKQLMYPSTHV